MTESAEDYELFHYGVKGMKWGVRRDHSKSSTRSTMRSRREAREARAQSNLAEVNKGFEKASETSGFRGMANYARKNPGKTARAFITDRDNKIKDAREKLPEAQRKSYESNIELAKAGVGLVRKKNAGHRIERFKDAARTAGRDYREYNSVYEMASKSTAKEIVATKAFDLGVKALPTVTAAAGTAYAYNVSKKTATKFGKEHADRMFNAAADSRGLPAPNTISLGPEDSRWGR